MSEQRQFPVEVHEGLTRRQVTIVRTAAAPSGEAIYFDADGNTYRRRSHGLGVEPFESAPLPEPEAPPASTRPLHVGGRGPHVPADQPPEPDWND